MNYDYEFIAGQVERIKKENDELGGLLFPFLETVQIQPPRLLFAKLISTSRPPYFACFAAQYVKDGRLKPNGQFISIDPEEMKSEGLTNIVLRRVRADITFQVEVDPIMGDIIGFSLKIKPNEEALIELFENENALRVTDKKMLIGG